MKVRAAASAAIAALVALGIAACAPIATLKPYDPSDGVNAAIGQVKLGNVLVITQSGGSGNLLFSAYNNSDELIPLTVEYSSGGVNQTLTATLLPDATSDFGYGKGGQFFLPSIDTKAGSLLPIYFQYGTEPGKQLDVPVLDGSLPQYSTLLPTATPTPKSTITPTPAATTTATPSPTPTPTP